jgi:hypothetical protein
MLANLREAFACPFFGEGFGNGDSLEIRGGYEGNPSVVDDFPNTDDALIV